MQAIIVSCCGCFHGRTLAVISMSCDNEATRGFGPLLPGHIKVDFGDAVALEKIFKGLNSPNFFLFIFYLVPKRHQLFWIIYLNNLSSMS